MEPWASDPFSFLLFLLPFRLLKEGIVPDLEAPSFFFLPPFSVFEKITEQGSVLGFNVSGDPSPVTHCSLLLTWCYDIAAKCYRLNDSVHSSYWRTEDKIERSSFGWYLGDKSGHCLLGLGGASCYRRKDPGAVGRGIRKEELRKNLWMLAVNITILVSLQTADILLRFLVNLGRYLDQILGSLATRGPSILDKGNSIFDTIVGAPDRNGEGFDPPQSAYDQQCNTYSYRKANSLFIQRYCPVGVVAHGITGWAGLGHQPQAPAPTSKIQVIWGAGAGEVFIFAEEEVHILLRITQLAS
ncbi:hypothetical protein P167DRAFT_548935 [Morchella conica CCBAS932]|uniref:Uncharacterized protein n=1 Tax=Morchella conica CCBAS932 TaxID=1392247 RepID=A0A3N4KD51_9PEZI|nr:hypothetical protein P167DRAFT_548935 [Morchella conica CCBAS932]